MSSSPYLKNNLLKKVFRNIDFTIAAVYISLHISDVRETGASEVVGGSYARQVATFDVLDGEVTNNKLLSFTSMPAVTITDWGAWDASSGGNFLWGGALAISKVVNLGDVVQIGSGDLSISID